MITITLEVDEITDTAYQNLSAEYKQRVNEEIRILIKQTIHSVRSQRLKKLRDELAKDTSCKELNAEILSELLRDED